MPGNGVLGPWEGIARVIDHSKGVRLPLPHPRPDVLASYLAGQLPPLRPADADEARLQALRDGTGRWTSGEVALHVASCRRCQAKVARMEQQPALRLPQWVDAARRWFSSPRHAPVGWSLAAVQAAAVIGLLVWMMAPRSAGPVKPVHPPGKTWEGQIGASDAVQPGLRVKFVSEVTVGELSETLGVLGMVVHGPDEEGYYRVFSQNASIENELRALPIVQEVRWSFENEEGR